ncbi:MAG: hypothetical protein U0973_13660 [Xanthomonadaceae bacterium]|nr:hypothetical protein [Xanthomonadaceae bacterium]
MPTPIAGLLGKADVPAAADTDLYTVPAGLWATVNFYMVNRTAVSIAVRWAVRSGAIGTADYMEYETVLPANGVLRETGVPVAAGETVTVRAAAVGCTAQVRGFEEGAQ